MPQKSSIPLRAFSAICMSPWMESMPVSIFSSCSRRKVISGENELKPSSLNLDHIPELELRLRLEFIINKPVHILLKIIWIWLKPFQHLMATRISWSLYKEPEQVSIPPNSTSFHGQRIFVHTMSSAIKHNAESYLIFVAKV